MSGNKNQRTMCDICGKRLWQHLFFVYGIETTACPTCYNKWIASKPPGSVQPLAHKTCRHCGDPECICDHEWSGCGLDEPIECLKCGDLYDYSQPAKPAVAGSTTPSSPTSEGRTP